MGPVITLIAGALVASQAVALAHQHHQHVQLHNALQRIQERGDQNATCGCTTTYTTFYGEPTCEYEVDL